MMLCSQCLSVPTSVIFTPLTILLSFLQFARFIYFILCNLCNYYIFLKQTSKGGKKQSFYSTSFTQMLSLCPFNWLIENECYKLHALHIVHLYTGPNEMAWRPQKTIYLILTCLFNQGRHVVEMGKSFSPLWYAQCGLYVHGELME